MGFRIYFGESILDIGTSPSTGNDPGIPIVMDAPAGLESIRQAVDLLLNEGLPQNIILRSTNPEDDFHSFREQFHIIRAGGGLVRNEDGDLLYIFRRGKWDLPKGKVEDGESIETCARREVEEECGIRVTSVDALFNITYHVYREYNGQLILKETFWFTMSATDATLLHPQIEEGITAIAWADVERQQQLLTNTYPLIKELVMNYQDRSAQI